MLVLGFVRVNSCLFLCTKPWKHFFLRENTILRSVKTFVYLSTNQRNVERKEPVVASGQYYLFMLEAGAEWKQTATLVKCRNGLINNLHHRHQINILIIRAIYKYIFQLPVDYHIVRMLQIQTGSYLTLIVHLPLYVNLTKSAWLCFVFSSVCLVCSTSK